MLDVKGEPLPQSVYVYALRFSYFLATIYFQHYFEDIERSVRVHDYVRYNNL